MRGARTIRLEVVLAIAAVVGAVAGFAAVGLEAAVRGIGQIAFGGSLEEAPIWRIAAALAAGNLLAATIQRRLTPGSIRNGVAEVIRAVARRGGRITALQGLVAFVAPAISIGTGASVGPEGPIALAGAAAGSALGRTLRLPPHIVRTLVGCGAAAGIAGIFNAPIAGVLFAGEVILGNFSAGTLMPTAVAAASGAAVARFFVGGAPAFEAPSYSVVSIYGVLVYVVLGIAGGLVSALFIRALEVGDRLSARLDHRWVVRALVGAAILAGIGALFPRILGAGYTTISQAIQGSLAVHEPLRVVAALALVKIVATALTIASGGAGGVFAPSIFIGAALGTAVGQVGRMVFGDLIAAPGAFSLVGMAAIVAGGMRSPVGGMMIVFEMTGDYALILPLMIASTISVLVAGRLEPESLYTAKLARLGERFRPGIDREVLARIDLATLIEPVPTIGPGARPSQVAALFQPADVLAVGVVDADGRLEGIVDAVQLDRALQREPRLEEVAIAADLAAPAHYAVTLDEDIWLVYAEIALSEIGVVPVVDDRRRLLGAVSRRGLLDAYRRATIELEG
jgi:CIC family chloride channel protein